MSLSESATNLGCPILDGVFPARVGSNESDNTPSWYPTLRKKGRRPRISHCAAPAMGARAAFYEESRMKFVDPTSFTGIRGDGHPVLFLPLRFDRANRCPRSSFPGISSAQP